MPLDVRRYWPLSLSVVVRLARDDLANDRKAVHVTAFGMHRTY